MSCRPLAKIWLARDTASKLPWLNEISSSVVFIAFSTWVRMVVCACSRPEVAWATPSFRLDMVCSNVWVAAGSCAIAWVVAVLLIGVSLILAKPARRPRTNCLVHCRLMLRCIKTVSMGTIRGVNIYCAVHHGIRKRGIVVLKQFRRVTPSQRTHFRAGHRSKRRLMVSRSRNGELGMVRWLQIGRCGWSFVLALFLFGVALSRPAAAQVGSDRYGSIVMDRPDRQRAVRHQCGRAALSGQPDQADDHLHAVRGAAGPAGSRWTRRCPSRRTRRRWNRPSSGWCPARISRSSRRCSDWSPSRPTMPPRRSAS